MDAFHPVIPWAIILLPFAGFLINGVVAFVAPRTRWISSVVGPGVVILAFAIVVANFLGMRGAELQHPVVLTYWSWMSVGQLQINAALQLDQLSILMGLVVTGVGSLIHVYSIGYMGEDPGYARYFAYLNLFIFFMLVLVLASSFTLMFVGWEGVGLCSYLLIGFWFSEKANADAGKKAFVVNRIGDFGFLVAMFLIFSNFGSLDFTSVFGHAPATLTYGGPLATAITLFLFLGATGKSAQIPLYIWLPDAMAGPTPVSALIHAATMVTAGVYLVARAGVLYSLAPVSSTVVAGIGALTALFAATIALAQTDIKKVLAYSTVSQLGYMFLGVGVGAYASGIFHLMTHAFFKALLFLGAGAVIHALHHAFHHTHSNWDAQDMRNMGGLRKFMPITWITMWAATLAISGVWPFAGFFSKDEIIWQAAARAVGPFHGWFTVYWVIALIAAILTAAYMTRLMVMTFHGRTRLGEEEQRHTREVPFVMWGPLAALGTLSLVGGWLNVPADISKIPVLGWVPSGEWIQEWLSPVTRSADAIFTTHVGHVLETAPLGGGPALWAVIAFALAVATIIVAVVVIGGRTYVPATESPPAVGLTRLLYRKWYVDEIYDAVIVRPLVALSRFAWRVIDEGIVDGVVNGAGRVSAGLGWLGSRLQSGQLNTYAFAVVIGVLLILGFVAL